MPDVQLSLRNVMKTFDPGLFEQKKEILKGLSLEIHRGEVFGFLGPNGAGKTTTIKAICDLIRPDSGDIEICGYPHTDLRAKRRIGFMPESPYFYQYLKGKEFLHFYADLLGLSRQHAQRRVADVLTMVGMEKHQSKLMKTFSKGMLQRMALAQSLLGEPDLLILDEPMSGLDPIGRRDVRDIILELKNRGTTIFFSSHIIPDVEVICDRIGIISDGRIQTIGSVHDIVAQEVETYEASFTGIRTGELKTPFVSAHNGSASSWVRINAAERDPLIKELASGAGHLIALTPLRSNLEDYLLKHYKEVGS